MKIFYARIIYLLLAISCFSFSSSEVSPFPFTESSLLWKIENPNLKTESYLFGTMHLIEKEYYVFPKKIEKLLSKSDELIMELAGIPTQTEALQLVQLKEGSLFDYFTPQQTDTILFWAKNELHVNEDFLKANFSKLKPFILIQLQTQLQFKGKTESYEMNIQSIAKSHKLEMKGLETIEQQLNFFENLPKNELTELVMEGFRNNSKSRELTRKMQQVYVRQNIDSLFLLFQQEGGILEKQQAAFLDERNQTWIPKITKEIASKKCFIAVGAGHLGGPNGIIRLLQKEGFTLTPIKF